jgi:hypothetical protein
MVGLMAIGDLMPFKFLRISSAKQSLINAGFFFRTLGTGAICTLGDGARGTDVGATGSGMVGKGVGVSTCV